MVEVTDAIGQSTYLTYENHLIVKRTDRNGNSFYWQYEDTPRTSSDGSTKSPRVVKTWGDGNVLAGEFEYYDHMQYNIVTNSLGHETIYHYDERNLCTSILYHDQTGTQMEYNDKFELVTEIDEENRKTLYSYNDYSQVISITYPDGSIVALEYDENGRIVSATNPAGGQRSWVYNDDGTINTSTDENGAITTYSYNDNKLLESVTNALGDAIHLEYDNELNLSQVTLPNGANSSWQYDNRGNCISATNPLGAIQRYDYDVLNRLTGAKLADGNNISLAYNAYDDIVRAKDNKTEVSFAYTILGSLQTRTQAGKTVKYQYNTEEQLLSITNEKGELYQFDRDVKGNISKEVGYDGVTRTYERDESGLVQKINRPNDRWTSYEHDKRGNIIRADYSDDTWDTFAYDKNGALVEATNQHTTVKFERSPSGQVIKETQDDFSVVSIHDLLGNRVQVSSSLGALIDVVRNPMGQAKNMVANVSSNTHTPWTAQMQYNNLGQEISRLLLGDIVSEWQYDTTGKPIDHNVISNNTGFKTRKRSYDWDVNNQLKSMTNQLTGNKVTYGYDEFSNLVSASYADNNRFTSIFRTADDVGNIYETADKSDRVYGEGSRLMKSNLHKPEYLDINRKKVNEQTEYSYDDEGNLIRKATLDGQTWQYEYFGNGMLAKVILPSQGEVSFKYDSLGRRIEKSVTNVDSETPSDTTIRFVWDGNNPIHEIENDNLTTWIFNDGFIPNAKITKDGSYSIVSDYLGTPVEAFDAKGDKVWGVELDIFGRVMESKESTGDIDFIPFRYQGQYHDVEVGLCYNRFRYYSPNDGIYIQQDPIRLAGGNPTLYGYVGSTNVQIDAFGLSSTSQFEDLATLRSELNLPNTGERKIDGVLTRLRVSHLQLKLC